jgi:metal-sulfur cluster biosynthetic enzyme
MATEKQVIDALRGVVDPEIGENIVDLGFVSEVKVSKSGVKVVLTLTTPFCPIAGVIVENAKKELERMKGVKKADVELDFERPWSPEMMADGVRKKLGFD